MKIFDALGAANHELVHPIGGWDTLIDLLDGTPRKASWRPIRVKIVKENESRPLLRSESPWLCMSFALVFREDALLKLGDFLSHNGEVLPLLCDEAPLYVWQPTTVIDAIDFEASDVRRFDSGRLMYVRRYAFHSGRVEGVQAFKTPDLRAGSIFFSESAAQAISHVVGPHLKFRLIWTDESKPPNKAPEPTPGSVTPRATESKSK
jgi:hypothetical protein